MRFGPLLLSVGPGVFVPRQRSLLLARAAVAAAKATARPVVLEAFCGVAPIAASVAAAVPAAELHVADVDPTALEFARRNAPTAVAHLGDGFAALPSGLRGRLDLIVAVPPYVPREAAALIPRDMLDHEPERALFGGADGLEHVRALIDGAREWLSGSGRLLAELNRAQYPAAAAYARTCGLQTRMRRGADGQTALLAASRSTAS